ncbi:hypothetical protein D3C71_2053220 [compost metagenome]
MAVAVIMVADTTEEVTGAVDTSAEEPIPAERIMHQEQQEATETEQDLHTDLQEGLRKQ